ncbi:FAD-linked oxidoreductase [Lachnellula suecica]|uniref:FAD-linked oxidoreductase n=1 Tax=Lachnellula suecica TaxID=602035 RepID=A0A8T9CDP4_9HELO|nr:FAD-linked oxidoreductase [Lachnellula suecica]
MGSVGKPGIEDLKATLSDSSIVITPDSSKYESSIKRWASSAEKAASMIVFPASAADVSKAVLFSREAQLELAIVCGGHATSGSSSTDGGLCLDLSKMRVVTVDAEKKTATVQGGALWADVDLELAKYELATVGGTVNHTGVGGLTLGGGYGYLTGQYGLVIDNLLEVELVLADGSIVNASESQNPDLFWAARGAGRNFGVATSFTFQAYEQRKPVWAGLLVFPKEKLDEVITAANQLYKLGGGRNWTTVGFGSFPPILRTSILVVAFFDGPEDEAKGLYEPLLNANPLVNTTGLMPYPSANSMLNHAMPHGLRRGMKGSAFMAPLDTKFAASIFKDVEDFVQKVPDAESSTILFEGVSFEKVIAVPQRATSFTNRGAYGSVLIMPVWTDSKYDNDCREWMRAMATKCRAEFSLRKEKGTDEVTNEGVGEYVNYDGKFGFFNLPENC